MVQLDLNIVLLFLDQKIVRMVFVKGYINWSEQENHRCYLPKQSFAQ